MITMNHCTLGISGEFGLAMVRILARRTPVVELKYPWRDQMSLACHRSVQKNARLGIYYFQIRQVNMIS